MHHFSYSLQPADKSGSTAAAARVEHPAIWQPQIDFIDLHAYPGFELNLKQHVENFGVNGMQDGAINGTLAPVIRPDPCSP
jgi:hypothetical protein